MSEMYDWSGFYGALCKLGPQLLIGVDEETRQIITLTAEEDIFWSDGLEDMMAQHAVDGDLRTGAVAALELWRENVLTGLSDNFGLDLDWAEVAIDTASPLIEQLVEAATPNDD